MRQVGQSALVDARRARAAEWAACGEGVADRGVGFRDLTCCQRGQLICSTQNQLRTLICNSLLHPLRNISTADI